MLIRVGKICRRNKVTFIQFVKELRRNTFEVVSLQGVFPLNFLWLMTAYQKLAFSPRGISAQEARLGAKPPRWATLNEIVSMKARVIIAQSELHREALMAEYMVPRAHIHVIPNGVSDFFFSPETREITTSQSKGCILFVGALGPWKGVDVLLESVNQIRQRLNKDHRHVMLIGSAKPWRSYRINMDWFPSLQRRFRHLFSEGIVIRSPTQPRKLIKQFYMDAAMLVLPSRFDAFGNVALEAMACGTPVILSDKVGVSGLIQDGKEGFVVKNGDASILADRMLYLLKHEGERRRMGDFARETASKYTWRRTASLYEQVFKSMQS
jgi:glycosyltransferase involved in cell wall biosynthesis